MHNTAVFTNINTFHDSFYSHKQARGNQQILRGGGAIAKPHVAPVTDSRTSKGEGGISFSHFLVVQKVQWRVLRDISLKKNDTRQKAAILYIFIISDAITGKSGLEGGWTEEIITDRSFRCVGNSSFYSRGLNSHLDNLCGEAGANILTGGQAP